MKSYESGLMKVCSKCKCCYTNPQVVFSKCIGKLDNLNAMCKLCTSEYDNIYRQKNRTRISEQGREYYIRNKERINKYRKKWYIDNKEYVAIQDKIYYENNKEDILEHNRNYRQTSEGKISSKKRRAKRRNLKFIPLFNNPFPKEIPVDYHHINDILVIPIPHTTHMKTLGNNHRKKCNKMLLKYYGLDVETLLGV